MASGFRITSTPAFERSARKLIRKTPRVEDAIEELSTVIEEDPLNLSRRHNIKKLTNVEAGDGQWRIRSGVYRLRYDVEGDTVTLHSINHRKDAY
jgi:mRNA-degrading endonuclease RelE of RelBE toxin-antitoxin system